MRGRLRFRFAMVGVPMLMLGLLGCPKEETSEPPVCLEDAGITASCTPTYEPANYDLVFNNTLKPSCAKSGVSCHASTGKQGGLDFDDLEGSYRALNSRNIVVAGKPECSSVVHRLIANDGMVRMPPGAPIAAAEQCAIIQWIANGAKR